MPDGLVRELFLEALAGGQRIQVQAYGGSMWPTLRDGQRLWVERLPPSGPVRGDLLVFDRDGSWVCHRLIDTRPRGTWSAVRQCILRGDSHRVCDEPVSVAQVVGRVAGVGAERRAPSRLARRLYMRWPTTSRLAAGVVGRAWRLTRWVRRLATQG